MMQVKDGITNRYRKMEQETTVMKMTDAPALSRQVFLTVQGWA